MPQLADMDRGTGMTRPGSPALRQDCSIAIAAVVLGKTVMSRRDLPVPVTDG